jgi:hypothetical protein
MRAVLVLVCIGASGIPLNASGAMLKIADDKMAVVDGERLFILGMYEYPEDEARLAALAEAGFNLVRSPEDRNRMDRLADLGLYAWINTGSRIDLSHEPGKRADALRTMAADWADHPAMLVWEVPDEALWNCWYRAQQWRYWQEPAQLRGKIAGLEDRTRAAQLKKDLQRAKDLHDRAYHEEAEALADSIWKALGETPPKPGYGLGNAPERAAAMCRGMIEGYQVLQQLDPAHPVWMNHAPRNQIAQLAAFNKGADIVGCDIYPVPVSNHVRHSDLAMQRMPAAGAFTDRMQAAAPQKPVWMVLQGFAWGAITGGSEQIKEELRQPTLEETRYMAWDAIVHGARGILYWGTHAMDPDAEILAHLLVLARELDALQPVISAPDANLDIEVSIAQTWGSVDRGVRVLAKQAADGVWLIVVNEWEGPLVYTLTGLDALNGVTYEENNGGESGIVGNGALKLHIGGEKVQILKPE